MDALILSCSTGGGHNSAGLAIKQELTRRGHQVTMLDPYVLAGKNLDQIVGNCYIKIAQKTPRLFGFIYRLGDMYRHLPLKSPVYAVNKSMSNLMKEYLEEHHFDVIIMPHLFPCEILTYMKRLGIFVPKMIFIATDYTCIPFTEETNCDYYVVPAKGLMEDFISRGIPVDKIIPLGIPVKKEFSNEIHREEAILSLGLDTSKHYLLLSGGSIGAGQIKKVIHKVVPYLSKHPQMSLIVICGNNKELYKELYRQYQKNKQLLLITTTDQMANYMKACDVFLSKPGGLSSTEAAVSQTPMIHIAPIPGCEIKNMEFFSCNKMSLAIGNNNKQLIAAIDKLCNPTTASKMRKYQRLHCNPNAASDICDLAERII